MNDDESMNDLDVNNNEAKEDDVPENNTSEEYSWSADLYQAVSRYRKVDTEKNLKEDEKSEDDISYAEKSESVEAAEPVEEAESVEEAEPVEEAESVEAAGPVEEAGTVEETEPVEEAGTVEETEPVEEAGTVEETEPVEEAGTVEETEPVEEAESIEEAQSAEEDDSSKKADITEDTESDYLETLFKNSKEDEEKKEIKTSVNRRELADKVVAAQQAAKRAAFDSAPDVKKETEPVSTKSPEELFEESYVILGEIGSGAGTAYKAMDRRSSQQVVIKKVHMQIQNLMELREDIEKIKAIHHPALPRVYDYVMYNGYVYSVMEYIEGRSLYRHISEGTHYSEKQVKTWAIQIADALKTLHQASPRIIHGDIKPSNIILASGNKVFLVDFNIGISEEAGAHSIGYSDGYAPPEQYDFVSANQYSATGRYDDRYVKTIDTNPDGIYSVQSGFTYDASSRAYAIIDEKSDVYSFGATFYFILTGKLPGSSAKQVTPITDTGVRISRKFRKIIARCMERTPKKRYQSARALLDALKKKAITMPMIISLVAGVAIVVVAFVFGPKMFEPKKSKPSMKPPEPNEKVVAEISGEETTPEASTVPEAEVTPEISITPEAEATPEISITPEAEVTPEISITPEAEVTPEISITPEAEVTPEISITPEAEVTPEISITPEAEVTPEISITPEAEVTPEISITPEAEVTPEITVTPEPTPIIELNTKYAENDIYYVLKDGSVVKDNVSKRVKIDPETVEWVYFGGYPTNIVNSAELLDRLSKTDFGSKAMVILDGIRYNKVNYKNSDGSIETIYFENESIKWKVLGSNNGTLTLVSEKIIDFEPVKKEGTKTAWSDSKLNSWLKSNFVVMAFGSSEKKLLSGDPVLLKKTEISEDLFKIKTVCTDYAKMGFNFGNSGYDAEVEAAWWIRPENNTSLEEFTFMNEAGEICSSKVSDVERKGMRPVITFKVLK